MTVEKVDKPTLMTGKHVSGTVIGAVRNWSRNVVLRNLAADSTFEPHTNNGGCAICPGAVTIESNEVTRNLAYYTIAHFSKLVRAGSHRIDSSLPDDLPNKRSSKQPRRRFSWSRIQLARRRPLTLLYRGKSFSATLQGGAEGTFAW